MWRIVQEEYYHLRSKAASRPIRLMKSAVKNSNPEIRFHCSLWVSGSTSTHTQTVDSLSIIHVLNNFRIFFLPWRSSPKWVKASSLSRLHSHTQTCHSRQDSSRRAISSTKRPLPDNTQHSQEKASMPPSEFEPTIPPCERSQSHALRRGSIAARTDTTQQSGQTSEKEVLINHITVYVSGYTETDRTGMLSPDNCLLSGPTKWVCFEPTVWPDICCV